MLAPVLVLEHEPVLADLVEASVVPLVVLQELLVPAQPLEQNQMWVLVL